MFELEQVGVCSEILQLADSVRLSPGQSPCAGGGGGFRAPAIAAAGYRTQRCEGMHPRRITEYSKFQPEGCPPNQFESYAAARYRPDIGARLSECVFTFAVKRARDSLNAFS